MVAGAYTARGGLPSALPSPPLNVCSWNDRSSCLVVWRGDYGGSYEAYHSWNPNHGADRSVAYSLRAGHELFGQ